MSKMVFAKSDHVITMSGNGFMRREDRKTPCGFREPPKGNTSKRRVKKGTGVNGWEVGR